MAILRDSRFCLYNSVIRLGFLLFTLHLFKTFIEQEKVDGAWDILHIFTPETPVWLHSSPRSHSAVPSVMSAQWMIRRNCFPDILLLCCSVWTVPLEAMAAVFLVFRQHSYTDPSQTMKVIIGTAAAIFPSPACYPHWIMYWIMYDLIVNVQSTTLCINLWASREKLPSLKGWKAIKGSAVMLKLCHLTPARRNTSTRPLHAFLLKDNNF